MNWQPIPPAPLPAGRGETDFLPLPSREGARGSRSFDALVIGAGPAGSVAAYELARRGLSVRLVDKAHFPRPKVCGCCLNAAAVNTLRRLGLGAVLATGVPLREVRVAAGRHLARVKLPGGVALSREAFDAALVAKAVEAGAEFQPGAIARLDDALAVARIVVVASGLAGNDAPPEARSRIGAGVAVTAEAVPEFFTPGTIFMATARGGYVGLVRVEDGRLDVAAAFDIDFVRSEGGPGPAAEAILRAVGWPGIPMLAELPWKGTPALTRHAKQLAGERWFTVGDAAGYVEPFTGEGMAWAVLSAAAVAPLAARAVQGWEPSLAREWTATHRRAIGNRQRVCRAVARVLRSPTLTTVAVRALSMLPGLSRPVVASLNRPSPVLGTSA